MGDVVNLNQYRKRRERADAARRAAANRAKAGRGKAERESLRGESNRRDSELDGKLIEREPGEDSPA